MAGHNSGPGYQPEWRPSPKRRHWSPTSQVYAPVEILLQYLNDGWQVNPHVQVEQHGQSGKWRAQVYYFELDRDDQSLILPVQGNPIVRRLLVQAHMTTHLVRSLDEAELPDPHPILRA